MKGIKTYPKVALAFFFALVFSVGSGFGAEPSKLDFLLPAPRFLPAFIYYGVAQQNGYFREEGIQPNFLVGKGGTDVAKQVGAGNALIGHTLPGNVIIVRSQGVPSRMVSLFGGHGLFFLIAPKAKGISDIKDVKGKTVGVMTFADGTFYELLAAMASAGLAKEDANIQAFGPGGTAKALITGKADAISGVIEWGSAVEAAGKPVNWIPLERYAPVLPQVLISSEKGLMEQRELVKRFVKASLRGFKFVLTNPEESAKIFAQVSPPYKRRVGLLSKIITRYALWVYGGQAILGEIPTDKLAKLQDYYHRFGIIRAKTEVKEMYTNELVRELAPGIK